MRSHDEPRQQKTPQGALSQEVAVKPQGTDTQGLSSSSAQVETPTCEGGTLLLGKVLERQNMLYALDRVELNKGCSREPTNRNRSDGSKSRNLEAGSGDWVSPP